MTLTQLLPEIFKLDPHDQLMIAEAIRERLEGKIPPIDEVEFRAELDRRAADADANPEDQISWEELEKELGGE